MSKNTKGEDRGHITRYSMTNVLEKLKEIHGKRFVDYRKAWDESEKCKNVPEYPLYIELGINSDCNLRCKMCARYHDDRMNHKHMNMSLELIDKIVEQCKEFKLPSILIGQESECFLHPQIKEIIQKVKMIDPVDFFIITNGTLLNKEMSKFLIEMEIDRLQISLDAATDETYKKIRGGDLRVVEKNIHDFIELRNGMGKERPFLRLSFCKQTDNLFEQEQFIEKWKDIADIVDFQEYLDLSNVLHPVKKEYKEYYCPDPFQRLVFDYDGNMYGCCSMGYNKYFHIGNINEMTIMEAWKSAKMEELRESFRTQKLSNVCLNCRANRGI